MSRRGSTGAVGQNETSAPQFGVKMGGQQPTLKKNSQKSQGSHSNSPPVDNNENVNSLNFSKELKERLGIRNSVISQQNSKHNQSKHDSRNHNTNNDILCKSVL